MRFLNLILPLTSLLTFILGCGESQPTAPKQWQKAKPIAGKLDHPQALVSDDKFLYFVTGGTVASQNEGTNNVMKLSLSGGEPVVIYKGGATIPDASSIALDATDVYFEADGFKRVSKNGGEAVALSEPVNMWEMILDSKNIYLLPFIGEGSPPKPIFSLSKSGGELKTLSEPRIMNNLCLDENFLYWTQADGIYKMPKIGGNIEKVYSAPNGEITSGLKADADKFYFLQGVSKRNLMSLAKTGGEAEQIAAQVIKFWLGEDEIVFEREISFSDNALFKVSKNGDGEIELDRNGYLADLTVGKDKIYLSDISRIFELAK